MNPNARLLAAALALAADLCLAAPFAQWLDGRSPSGRPVRIWGEGDEFSASFEAEDGHAVLLDESGLRYCYARRDEASGALVRTAIPVGDESPADRLALAGIPLHLRDTSREAAEQRAQRIAAADEAMGLSRRWEETKARTRAARKAAAAGGGRRGPPPRPTRGSIVGLTLLVDFPLTNAAGVVTNTLAAVSHPGVTKESLEELLNGENCTLYGNASSVRKYFEDVSCGRMSCTNIVLGWFTAAHPRDHYDDPSRDNAACGRELIGEILLQIAGDPDYGTRYLPLLRQVSYEGANFLALNVWFAGPTAAYWGKGLWAHASGLWMATGALLPVEVDGQTRTFNSYQMTPVTSSPSIGTFCHENGHMLCGFPDLYDKGRGSGGPVGPYSIMSVSGSKNPCVVDAYLRAAAGWVEPRELPDEPSLLEVTSSPDDVWKRTNPADPRQYYLIENRRKAGRDAGLPGSGILIWRCDEAGGNSRPSPQAGFEGAATNRVNAELSLEQADGLYELERFLGSQDANDLWFRGNGAAGYGGVFSPDSSPCAKWRDASDAAIRISRISASGETMTFFSGDPGESAVPVFFADLAAGGPRSLTFAVTATALGKGADALLVYAEIESDDGERTSTSRDYLGRLAETGVERLFTVSGLAAGQSHDVRLHLVQEGGGSGSFDAAQGHLDVPPDAAPWDPDSVSPPASPASLSATEGTVVPGVRLVWTAAAGARRYAVYRAASDSPAAAELVGRTEQCEYLDIACPAATTLRYWVRAENGAGDGDFAGPAAGWRPSPLAVETSALAFGVAGTALDETLSAAGGRPPYAWSLAEDAALPGGLSLEATGRVHGIPAAPFAGSVAVRVADANGTVAQGVVALDIRAATRPAAVAALALAEDYGRLVLTWETEAGVDRTRIYRSETPSFPDADEIGSAVGASFADATVEEGTEYFYWVVAENWLGPGPAGDPVSGASKVSAIAGDVYVHAAAGDDDAGGGDWKTAKRTIQAAVDSATAGCRIVVAPGVYAPFESRNLRVAIESAEGPWTTVIDGGGTNRCATLSPAASGTNTFLIGFTLANGRAPGTGDVLGGGSFGGTLLRCVVSNCAAFAEDRDAYGGGAFYGSLRNCLVVGNRAESRTGAACGGGCYGSVLYNCTVVENAAETGLSASFADGGGVSGGAIANTIVWGNALATSEGVFRSSGANSSATPYSSDVQADPLFADPAGGDWRLASNSPCLGAGAAAYVDDAIDLAGNPRLEDGRVDMGAFQGGVAPAGAPAQTAGVRARSDADYGGVLLRWRRLPWAESYKVYRGAAQPAAYAREIGETAGTSFLDSGVGTGRTYWYRVVPVNGFGAADIEEAAAVPVDVQEDGANWYVDAAAGDDAADGRSWATAKRSIRAVAPLLDEGDLVLVGPGRYEPIVVDAVPCEIRGVAGADATFLDGGGTNRCARLAIDAGDAADTVLTGLSLVNGLAAEEGVGNVGGGAFGGMLQWCVVSNCAARSEGSLLAYGGGTYGASAWNTRFLGNRAQSGGSNAFGGGAYSGEFYNCLFHGNEAVSGGAAGSARGGGVAYGYTYRSTLVGNAARNTAGGDAQGGGAMSYYHYGSILWGNEAATGPDIGTNSLSRLYTCCVQRKNAYVSGCITNDPQFVDAATGDWRLAPGSPCLDAGYVSTVYGDLDLQGAARIQGAKVDIGAFEGAWTAGEETVRPLTVATRLLPAARVGEAYSAELCAEGGVPPYSWGPLSAYAEYHAASSFQEVGAAMGWKGNDKSWELPLPFDFPFYESAYTSVWVNSNGTLAFDRSHSSSRATVANLSTRAVVAVLWHDLDTSRGDIYVDSSAAAVTIRWSGAYYAARGVSFSATLHPDGTIWLRYGAGNANGGLVGVSSGGGLGYTLSPAGGDSMENADDIVFVPTQIPLPAGLSLSPAGVLSGVPTTAGGASVGAAVTDGAGAKVGAVLFLPVEAVPDATSTTPVPVPYAWLEDEATSLLAAHGGDYEAAAHAVAENGENAVWECYVAGLSPADADARFETTIAIGSDGRPIVSWRPRLSAEEEDRRVYRTFGRPALDSGEDWSDVTDLPDVDAAGYRFFKVRVRLK